MSVASFNVEDFSPVFLHPIYYFIRSVCPTIISDSPTFRGLTALVFPHAEFELNRHRFLNFTFLSARKKKKKSATLFILQCSVYSLRIHLQCLRELSVFSSAVNILAVWGDSIF